jgi:hypothetical protein
MEMIEMTTTEKQKFMSRFYVKALVFLAVMTMLLLMVESAAVARDRDKLDCEDGDPVAYIGIVGLSFKGSMSIDSDEGTKKWHFQSEPKIRAIDPDSPAAGILERGDVIVEIDGMLITTRKAGKRFGSIEPGETVEFTVRRDGKLLKKKVKAGAVCPEDHPMHFDAEALAHLEDLEVDLEHLSESLERMSDIHITIPEIPEIPDIHKMMDLEELAELSELEALEGLSVLGEVDFWPRAWYGMGISCDGCTINASKDDDPAQWRFDDLPSVHTVDDDGPADEAGIREGDVLTHINGVALDTDKGGELFSNAEPGTPLEWTIERDGKSKKVTMNPLERPPHMDVYIHEYPSHTKKRFKLRFSGEVGNTGVEVMGTRRVKVKHDEENGVVVVTTPDGTVKVRVADKKK